MPIILASPFILFIWHFNCLSDYSLWYDEFATWKQATSLNIQILDNHLFNYLIHFVIKFFKSESEVALRSVSAIAGSFIPITSFFLAKLYLSKRTAYLIWGFLASSPLIIYLSREARVYSLLILAIAATVLTLTIIYRRLKDGKELKYYPFFVIISIQTLNYSHFFGICLSLLFIGTLVFKIFYKNNKKRFKPLLYLMLLNLIFMLPSIYRLLFGIVHINNTNFWVPLIDNHFQEFIDLLHYFYLGKDFSQHQAWRLILAISFIPILSLFKKGSPFRKKIILCLIAWFLIPIISVLIFSHTIFPIYFSRYLLVSYFPSIALFCIGISLILDGLPLIKPINSHITMTVILMSTQFSFYMIARNDIHGLQHSQAWREASKYLSSIIEKNDLLIRCDTEDELIGYYTRSLEYRNLQKINMICHQDHILKFQGRIDAASRIILFQIHNKVDPSLTSFLKLKYKHEETHSIKNAKFWIFTPKS